MQTIPQLKSPAKPWYREPWPWLLMAGPAAVVVAGAYTTVLAFSSTDGLVADDYYKQGLAINRTLQREQRAQALDLSASLSFNPESGRVRVVLSGAQLPTTVVLRLTHPTRMGQDRRIELARSGAGNTYEGASAVPQGANHWNAVLETPEWRLAGVWADPARVSLRLAAGHS
jgi:hypothetical protein